MRITLKVFFLIVSSHCIAKLNNQSGNYEYIQDKRDEVYSKLAQRKINLSQANKIYGLLQQKCLNEKDYGNFIELYIYKSVDFYVPRENYQMAIEVTNEGLKQINILNGITKDTIEFKLKSEIVEYYRRLPNQSSLVQKKFEELNNDILSNPKLEKLIPTFIYGFYNNYGRFIDDLGDSEKSFELFKQAQFIAKRNQIKLGYFTLLSNISKYYREKKDYVKALEILNEAMDYAESDEKKVTVLISLSRTLQNQNQLKSALKKIDIAEKVYQKSKEKQPRNFINILITRGEILLKLKSINQSIQVFRKALKYLNSYDNSQKSTHYVRILNNLSECFQQKGEYYIAKIYNNNVLSLTQKYPVKTNPYPQEYFNALIQKGELNPESQIDNNIKAIQLTNELRQTFDLPESKLFYSEKVSPIFEKTITIIVKKYNFNKSKDLANKLLFVIESSKSATLLDISNIKKYNSINSTDSLYLIEKKLNQRIVKLQIKLLEGGDEKVENELAKTKIQLSEINQKLYKNNQVSDLISIEEIQSKLDKNQTFINYFLGNEALYAIIVNTDNFQVMVNNDSKEIYELSLKTFQLISKPIGIGRFQGDTLLKKMYQYIIKPYDEYLNKNIIISRHGILGYIPFESLISNKTNGFLIKNHIISYANSATLYFSNSKINTKNYSILSLAPFAKIRTDEFDILPYSSQEIKGIQHIKIEDNNANLEEFRKSYPEKSVIHFATHAIIDEATPLKSFIAFYPQKSEYRLYLPEIYNLKLQNTALVFLSACNTANGKIINGEGIMSISRGFQVAGCESVISTIWQANDQSTALISQQFYNYVESGKSFDEALSLSKIELLNSKSGLYGHPYYWANLILIGKPQKLKLTNPKTIYWYFGGIILILWLIIMSNRKFRNDKLRHH